MKRLIALLLLILLTASATACTQSQENICHFYYLRTGDTIRYGESDGLIAPVSREFSSPDAGLDYLLQRYLDGPAEDGFRSPIPKGTYLLQHLWENDTLILVLSREFSELDNMELTLAGACLSATCQDLVGAQRIEVRSGDSIYTFDLNDYTFLDGSTGQ